MHLGNARTFLVNWLLARQRGWRVLMRIEDLDGPRIKHGADKQLLEELAWLGLSWEAPVVYQSQRAELYRQALHRLAADGHAYPCTCSRRDVETAAGAPHADDGAIIYNGACRGRYDSAAAAAAGGRAFAWRLRVPSEPVAFVDGFAGPQCFDLAKTCGDFVVCKADGLAAYQLAVVLDDAAAGVDAIVRGDDLLESAARQMHLRKLLNLAPSPRYWHLPLVVGPDGRRLAKRHGDTRLAHYRSRGIGPQRILGLLGYWCGLLATRREAGLPELLERFDLSRLPRDQVVFTPQDDAFLS
jgi:glutamyl-tRNA synthetase